MSADEGDVERAEQRHEGYAAGLMFAAAWAERNAMRGESNFATCLVSALHDERRRSFDELRDLKEAKR